MPPRLITCASMLCMLLPLTVRAADAESQAWAMPAEERAAIAAIIDQVFASVLPDPRGATLVLGKIRCSYAEVPADSNVQHQEPWDSEGLHLRHSDGRWWQNGAWLLEPTVTVKGIGSLRELALDQPMPDPGWGPNWREQWFSRFGTRITPADQPRLRPATAGLVLVGQSGFRHGAQTGRFVANLLRAGHHDAEAAALVLAAMALWDDATFRWWQPDEPALELGASHDGEMAFFGLGGEASEKPVALMTADVALRRALYGALREDLLRHCHEPNADVPLPTAATLDLMAALLAPDEARAHQQLHRLRALLALPNQMPDEPNLATRLVHWLPDEEDVPATDDDLDALLALLDRDDTARWIDDEQSIRSLGEVALLALAHLIGTDPRLLVGRDPTTGWTEEERAATVAALREWRAATPMATLTTMIAAQLTDLPSADLPQVVMARDAAERGLLLDQLVLRWQNGTDLDVDDIVTLLPFLLDHPGLRAVILAWPVADDLAPALALVHARYGDRSHLDRMLEALINRDDATGLPLFWIAATTDQVRQALVHLGDLDHPLTKRLVPQLRWADDYELIQVSGDDSDAIRRRSAVNRGVALLQLLADRRLAPTWMQEQWGEHGRGHGRVTRQSGESRVCDAVAVQLHQISRQFGAQLAWQVDEAAFTLTATPAQRDAAIGPLFITLLRRVAVVAAEHGLDMVLPEWRVAVPGDPESLY